ncbi:MAG: DUF4136 domain-containing protein [Leadbetterella sp.]|nr:DUF4136 domain-containing protein [Leadbetterella sp.]
MKTYFVFTIITILSLSGCSSVRNITDHDYRYETNFSKYQTYNFLRCENDNTEICNEIKATIKKQMEIRGYVYDPLNADIYVGYALLPNKVVFKSYQQPAISKSQNGDDSDDFYKIEKYNYRNGIIMLSLIDAETDILVWRGFSTDNSKSKKAFNNSKYYYSNVVRSIFSEYPLYAKN